jgi:hypothetical protein
MTIITALRRQKQDGKFEVKLEFQASLGYMVRPCLKKKSRFLSSVLFFFLKRIWQYRVHIPSWLATVGPERWLPLEDVLSLTVPTTPGHRPVSLIQHQLTFVVILLVEGCKVTYFGYHLSIKAREKLA